MNLHWTTTETGIEEARPALTVRYFIVPDKDQFFPCISEGIAYKVIRQLSAEGGTKENARQACERDWQLRKP